MISRIYSEREGHPDGPGSQKIRFRLAASLASRPETGNVPRIFFRADDIGVPSRAFFRMMDLFVQFQVPLCLAVVPSWLTRPRWETMKPYWERQSDLFCWHMHGWRHQNHEPMGKKHEFGPSQRNAHIDSDLERGMDRLKGIMGKRFSPVFTPPWNRCSAHTLNRLKALGFKAVSRDKGAKPPPIEDLYEFPVNVDLHTRREQTAEQGWDKLFLEIQGALRSGTCGFMLHHMRMNDPAFDFLSELLSQVREQPGVKRVNFDHLVDSKVTGP
ncbi:MAG: hypothetical protein D3926_15735 [Desulfobacteraceae bacterium]|nr:MAG: hypothetical protein D3926_15735 [Desulfobacteraceae bacterium]